MIFFIPVRSYPLLVTKSELDSFVENESKIIKGSLRTIIIAFLLIEISLAVLITTSSFILEPSFNLYNLFLYALWILIIASAIKGVSFWNKDLSQDLLDREKVSHLKSSGEDLISIIGPIVNQTIWNRILKYCLISVVISFLLFLLAGIFR